MNHSAKVFLHWLVSTPTQATSPRGSRFSMPARFDHQSGNWMDNAWSLVITAEGTPDTKGEQFAVARFLMASAPHGWLDVGERFTLFEGELAVAEGVIQEVLSE